jgi:hypothetical protein
VAVPANFHVKNDVDNVLLLVNWGSNPFPGATNIVLGESPGVWLFGFSEDFCILEIADKKGVEQNQMC